jgi:predicted MFS family arabinose efflux permease
MLGVLLGGIITARWGWRTASGMLAIPGLVLAVAFLWLRDYRTVPLTRSAVAARQPFRTTLAELFRARSAVAAYIGGAFQLMVVSTLYTWLPSYLNRTYGFVVDGGPLGRYRSPRSSCWAPRSRLSHRGPCRSRSSSRGAPS